MQDGKLLICPIDDAVALALENNLDIGIARYNLNIADTDVVRAKAGAGDSGRQRRRGPGHARRRGGRARRTGGFRHRWHQRRSRRGWHRDRRYRRFNLRPGTGASPASIPSLPAPCNGIISTNSPAARSPVCRCSPRTHRLMINFAYTQGFQTGTNMSVGFNNTRTSTNSPFTTLSPLHQLGIPVQAHPASVAGFWFRSQQSVHSHCQKRS